MLQDYSFGVFTSYSDAEALWGNELFSAAHPDVFFFRFSQPQETRKLVRITRSGTRLHVVTAYRCFHHQTADSL